MSRRLMEDLLCFEVLKKVFYVFKTFCFLCFEDLWEIFCFEVCLEEL